MLYIQNNAVQWTAPFCCFAARTLLHSRVWDWQLAFLRHASWLWQGLLDRRHLKQTGWPIQEWRRRAFPPVRPPSPDPLSEVSPPSPSFAHIVDHHRLVRFIQTWHVVAGQISGPKALRTPTFSLWTNMYVSYHCPVSADLLSLNEHFMWLRVCAARMGGTNISGGVQILHALSEIFVPAGTNITGVQI